MKEKARRLRTGAFIVGSLLLFLAILFFLGGRDLFTKKIKVCTYFDESVQGLSRGAAVKFKGAPIGTVSDVRIIFPDYVLVEMELDESNFTEGGDFEDMLRYEIRENGLNCRLEYVGITGLKFVEFDYHTGSKHKKEPPSFITRTNAIYVPSVSSSLADIATSISGVIEKLNQINIKEISEEVTEIMRDVRALLSDPALTSTLQHVNQVTANLENTSGMLGRVVDEERLENLVTALEDSLKNLQRFIQRMDEAAGEAKIPESAAAFRHSASQVAESASSLKSASAAVVEGQQEMSNTMLKLNQAIDSLRMLIEYIERDPGSLIRGKGRPNVKK